MPEELPSPFLHLYSLPLHSLVEYAVLDKGKKEYPALLESYVRACESGEINDRAIREPFLKQSVHRLGFFQDFSAVKEYVTIAQSGEITGEDGEVEFKVKPANVHTLETLTYLSVLEPIPEYELRESRIEGLSLLPLAQERGVRAVLNYRAEGFGPKQRAGYVVGSNLGAGFLRVASGFTHNLAYNPVRGGILHVPAQKRAQMSHLKKNDDLRNTRHPQNPFIYQNVDSIRFSDIFSCTPYRVALTIGLH